MKKHVLIGFNAARVQGGTPAHHPTQKSPTFGGDLDVNPGGGLHGQFAAFGGGAAAGKNIQ